MLLAFGHRRLGRRRRARDVQVAHAEQHQQHHRQRQKRHKEEGGLPVEGIEDVQGDREAKRGAQRRAEQPQHGGARLQLRRKA